jgi:hypothetical protein
MTGYDVLQWVQAKPFVPFRIRINSGRTYDVRHPEMVKVSHTQVLVFSYPKGMEDLVEKTEMVGLQLVETIEPLKATRSQKK